MKYKIGIWHPHTGKTSPFGEYVGTSLDILFRDGREYTETIGSAIRYQQWIWDESSPSCIDIIAFRVKSLKEAEKSKPKTVQQHELEKLILSDEYHRVGSTTCVTATLRLTNGWVLIGQSAAINPDMFDLAKGRALAKQDALSKLRELEAYHRVATAARA